MRAFVDGYYGVPYETVARHQGICTGTVDRCIAWLNEFVAAGAQTIVLRFGSPDQLGQIEVFAREVLPRIRRS
jgi:alkanesulfonate monooxygenase SsuD/methylene tetrahydromethanopterin reductase-like flavin-dependent oxidoreductase (luciferase family)